MPLNAIFNPLSSTKPEIVIRASSNEVSFKSAATEGSLLNVPPLVNGCDASQRATPSPPAKAPAVKALFNIYAAFTCFVCAIDLANARVYLAPRRS